MAEEGVLDHNSFLRFRAVLDNTAWRTRNYGDWAYTVTLELNSVFCGHSVVELEHLTSKFAKTVDELFHPYTVALFEFFRQHGIEPFLVTGAHDLAALAVADALSVPRENVFGCRLAHVDGILTDQFLPGFEGGKEEKRSHVMRTTFHHSECLAIGDSESDVAA